MAVRSPDTDETTGRQEGEAVERRSSPRYAPGEDRIWLAWWAAPGSFRVIGCLLLNIGRGGLALVVDEIPGVGATVWLRLDGRANDECVAARVVGARRSPAGPHVVRLAFPAPCSGRFFRAALRGRAVVATTEREAMSWA
jgi:hypothetical protein